MSRRQRDIREVAIQVADLEEGEADRLLEEAQLEAEMADYDAFDIVLEPLGPEPYFDPFPDDVGDDDLSDPLNWWTQVADRSESKLEEPNFEAFFAALTEAS